MRHFDPISLIYDAALGEASWDETLDAIGADAEDAVLCLGIGDPRNPQSIEIWSRGFDPLEMIPDGHHLNDIWNPEHNPGVRAGMIMPVGRVLDRRTFVSDETYFSAPFMHHFYRKVRLTAEQLFVPLREGDFLAGGFLAGPGGAELGSQASQRFENLLPHLGRALRLRNEVGRYRGIAESLAQVLDRLPFAVFLLDETMRVLGTNAEAETILAANDGLTSVRGALRLSPPPQDRDLRQRVARIARLEGMDDPATLRIARSSELPPYVLRLFPAIGACNLPGAGAAVATLIVHDPASPQQLPEAGYLCVALGLTPAEAEIARLVPLSLSKRQLGERLGLSENTIRFHLSAMRAKLGARNVSDLARIIDRVSLMG